MPDVQVYDWRDEALCAYVGSPDSWFPGPGGTPKVVRKVCALCPVRQECLMFAIENGEFYGIWGGMVESERAAYALANGIAYLPKVLAPLQEIDGYDRPDVAERNTEAAEARRAA